MTTEVKSGLLRKLGAVCLLVVLMIIVQRPAEAQFGIDLAVIMAGLNQINTLLNTAVGTPLKNIQKIEGEYSQYQREVVCPLNAINQLKGTIQGYRNQMLRIDGIMNVRYTSAQLPAPQALERLLLSSDPNSISQVDQAYQQVYGALPSAVQAPQDVRYAIDVADAQAQDAMKKAIQLEALSQRELEVSQQLQDQIHNATPGTAPMVEAIAAAWVVRANAYSQSAMAQLIRVRSASVASQSAGMKQNTVNTNGLAEQIGTIVSTKAH